MDRWLQLVLLMPENECITCKELAEALGVSTRTIYDDILQLNRMMLPHGAQLEARPYHGVKLSVTDRTRFLSFLDTLEADGTLRGEIAESRINKIIRVLLQTDAAVKSDDLCEMLHVSRSTLKKDLRMIRPILSHYDLQLLHQPYAGLRIDGTEKNIRRCMAKLGRNMIANDGEFLSENIQKLAVLLQNIFRRHAYRMAAYSFQNFVLHVYVSICRIRLGREIARELLPYEPADPQVCGLAKDVSTALTEAYGIQFTKSEHQYILLHLECKKIISWKQVSLAASESYELVREMLQSVENVFCYNFSHDFELIAGLSTHLIPMRTRLLYDMPLDNPMMQEIRETEPLAYEMANVACGVLQRKYEKEIPVDETGYIALYFHVALERSRAQRRKNVLIVCGTGKSAAALLAYKIKDAYGKHLNVVGMYESADFIDRDLETADYILSTTPIKKELPIPVIELGHGFPWNKDKDIREHLKREQQKTLLGYFSQALFLPHMSASGKEDVLRQMCRKTAAHETIPEDFYEHVMQRERIGGTALGNGVATPHPDQPLGERSLVVIGILDTPILWDQEDVQIIFLLSMKVGGDRNLPLFYKMISRFLTNKTIVRHLIKQQTFENMIAIFSALSDDTCVLD